MFVSQAEEQEVHTSIRLLLYAGSIGAVTGWVAWRAGNFQVGNSGGREFQISLADVALLVAAIAAHLGAYAI
jgi:hypothetical protein